MIDINSALPDLTGLSDFEREIYEYVLEKWPTSPLEIAENFREDVSSREKKKRLSTKYAYYLKKLVQKRLLLAKKAGNSMIVWPFLVEKYRVIHEILNDKKPSRDELFFSSASSEISSKKSLQKSTQKGAVLNA